MTETLLKRIPPTDLPEFLATAWQRSAEIRGDSTLFEVFGNHPELYRWYADQFYGELFHGGKVPRQLKELLRLRLSTLHGCLFCNRGNRLNALEGGLSQAQIDAIDDYDAGPFSDAELAVLRLADQIALTNPNGQLEPALYRGLRQHFTDAEVLELGMLAGLLSGMAKFLFTFDLVEREPTCPFHPEPATEPEESST
jgi:AhpD family alkylhydroperoxidase